MKGKQNKKFAGNSCSNIFKKGRGQISNFKNKKIM